MLVNVAAFYQSDADREVRKAWTNDFARALQPNDDAAYVGFLSDDGPARIRSAYPGATWDRLTSIKSTYDPTNLFRLNQNIPPTETGVTTDSWQDRLSAPTAPSVGSPSLPANGHT